MFLRLFYLLYLLMLLFSMLFESVIIDSVRPLSDGLLASTTCTLIDLTESFKTEPLTEPRRSRVAFLTSSFRPSPSGIALLRICKLRSF